MTTPVRLSMLLLGECGMKSELTKPSLWAKRASAARLNRRTLATSYIDALTGARCEGMWSCLLMTTQYRHA
eukprot:4362311-Amphidinium_carterae.3